MRRSFSSRRVITRARRKTQWARFTLNDVAPALAGSTYDLLGSYKTAAGITLNLPGITIGRIRFKVSITITVPAATAANDGCLLGLALQDSTLATVAGSPNANPPVTQPYDVDYMLWDQLYRTESVQLGEPTAIANVLYKEYDIKSMRKITRGGQTLGLTFQPTGGVTAYTVSMTGSVLLLMP